MHKIINSPIAITLIVIVAAFVLAKQNKAHLAGEIQATYDTLVAIAADATSDAEKTKAVQDLAEQLANQIKVGFSSGWNSTQESDKKFSFLEVRKQIKIENLKEIPTQWETRQSVIFTLKNESDYPIEHINLNLDYYKDGILIDTKHKSLHGIKILAPGEATSVKEERSFPKRDNPEEMEALIFDSVKANITSFQIIKE